MGEEVTRHHRSCRSSDHEQKTDVAGAGQRAGGQEQGERGDEGADEKDRLGQDGGGPTQHSLQAQSRSFQTALPPHDLPNVTNRVTAFV